MKWQIIFACCLSAFLSISLFIFVDVDRDATALADESEQTSNDTTEKLEDAVDDSLQNIDFSAFDKILADLEQDKFDIFGTSSFFNKVNQILSGDMGDNFGIILLNILNLFFGNVGSYVPLICMVVGIAILGSLVTNLKSEDSHNIDTIVNFACFGLIVVIVSAQCVSLLDAVQTCIQSLKVQMDVIFPILLTLLASIGGTVSVGIFQTSTAVLSNLVLQVFTLVVIPLFLISFVFSILGNLVESIKLSKFNDFINTLLKWLIGIIFGIFSTVLTIQGIVVGSYDGMSINATKFALKSYIPVLGGYLSEGFNYAVASSVLIKNSIGFAGLLLLLSSIIPTFVRIVAFAIFLKLGSAIVEPMGMSKVSNFLNQTSRLMFYLVGILLAVSFMYVLTLGLLMCLANGF